MTPAYLDDQGNYRLKSMFDTATTSANASQHIIRTAAGNELLMDDMADSEKINLHTKDQKNILTLDANSEGHRLALRTEEGLAEFYAKKTIRFESGDTYTLITGNNQTITVENKHSLQTNKKEIAFDAATDILLTAKHNIKLNTEKKDISLTSGQDLIIEAGKGMAVRVMDGDNSINIQQGSVSIEAAKAITILSIDGPITLENGGGMLELSDGKLSVMGTTVSVEGSSVAIKGQTAEMMGGGGGGGAAKAAKSSAPKASAAPATPTSSPAAVQTPVATAPVATATKAVAPTPPVEAVKKEEDKGKFITAAEGQKIADVAKKWKDTPYAPRYTKVLGIQILVRGSGKYAGGNPVKGEGADCSGAVWAIYKEAGLSYGTHTNTAGFPARVGTDVKFTKGTHFFKKVDAPQVGDIGWWNGHMAIYDPKAGKTNTDLTADCWSASNPKTDRLFGPAVLRWFEKHYGTKPIWYRYWKAG